MSGSRATLAKVAALAGVSRSQASDALRGSGRVSDESRKKVLAAARHLGYRTDSGARSLRTGSTRLIALHLDPGSTQDGEGGLLPFWSRVLASFAATVEAYGYRTIIDITGTHAQVFDLPASAVLFVSTSELTVEIPSPSAGGFGSIVSFLGSRSAQSPDHATLMECHHDYAQIGADIGSIFRTAGSQSVLLLRRPGEHHYQEAIEGELRTSLELAGISLDVLSSDGSPSGQEAIVEAALAQKSFDGVCNLGGRLPSVISALERGGLTPALASGDGRVKIVNQADSLGDLIALGPVTLLKLDGARMGVSLGEHITAAIAGREVGVVLFEYEFVQTGVS